MSSHSGVFFISSCSPLLAGLTSPCGKGTSNRTCWNLAQAAAFASLDAAGRHRLRILVKRQRYAVEFLGSLFKAAAVKRHVRHLSAAQDALGKGEEDFATHDKMQQATAHLQRVATELRQCVRFVVVVLEKIVAKGFHPHLEDLLTRLNFNHFYDRIKGRGRAAISQPL